jgi:hypothetical protein
VVDPVDDAAAFVHDLHRRRARGRLHPTSRTPICWSLWSGRRPAEGSGLPASASHGAGAAPQRAPHETGALPARS